MGVRAVEKKGVDGGEERLLGAGVLGEVGTNEHEGLEVSVSGAGGNLIGAVAQEALQHVAVFQERL